MYGRYGFDQFGRFLFILSLIFWALSLILSFTPLRKAYYAFWALNTAIYIYAFYRILSKNIPRRTVENDRYLRARARVAPRFERLKTERLDKDHVFRKCPYCKSRLRMRRVRGRHTTRCPKCGTTFGVFILFGKKQK